MRKVMIFFLLYFTVFATGASGLIFQVTWQKYVSRLLGSDTVATAIIIGTFLGGLSLGYYLCGRFSTLIKNHFKAYALLEGTIGIWCLCFPTIFHLVESLSRSWSFAPPWLIVLQGMVCSVLLMGVPTICMGGTIPFLTRGISRNVAEATNIHANVYAINTTGAFIGTLVAGFYLIPTHGLPLTIMGASFLNLGASLFFYLVSAVLKPVESPEVVAGPRDETTQSTNSALEKIPSARLYSIAFLSGFYVMTLENVLIRIINISVGSSSYSFSLIIAVFILAIAIGSYAVGRSHDIPRQVLWLNQFLITLSLLAIYLSLDTWPYWAHIIRIAFQSNIVGFWGYYIGVFLALTALLGFPVALMGATIPLTFHELKRDLQHVGTHSGMLFSWNTLGNLTGSLIGGIVLYYFLNNARVFLAATLLAACSTYLAGWHLSKKYVWFARILTILVVLIMSITPFYSQTHFVVGTFLVRIPFIFSLDGPTKFFKALQKGYTLKFYKDGPTATVAVVESPQYSAFPQKPLSIMINGKSDSSTIGDLYTIKLATHIPALLAEARKNVLVIGLGTGVSAGELTLYPDVEQIDIAEISSTVIDALPYFQEFIYGLQKDPRVRIHLGDAFRILARSQKKWDIVLSEPSNPWVTGVDLLFTQEFYQLAREHLTEKGILLQWMHTQNTNYATIGMILNTLQQEFTQARVFIGSRGDLLIVASNKHLSPSDLQRAEDLLQTNAAVKASLGTLDLDSLDALLLREYWTPTYITDHFSDFGFQTMDNPRLHYIAGKSLFIGEHIEDNRLFTSASASYWHEYLMAQKHPDWDHFPLSKPVFDRLFLATRDKLYGEFFPMATALKLKAYLSNAELFPLSPKDQNEFKVDLLPFIMHPIQEEAWGSIGLKGASVYEKIQPLLDHVQTRRNWIVPYPIDGLRALLQAGMLHGNDGYEKNWCALQLALLIFRETHDRSAVQTILDQLVKQADGAVTLREQDRVFLNEINNLMGKVSNAS